MKVRTLFTVLLVVAGGLATAAPASAHRNPANCNANKFDVNLSRDKFTVKNGDVINYSVSIKNVTEAGEIACDVSGITRATAIPERRRGAELDVPDRRLERGLSG